MSLAGFHPTIQRWFAERLGEPSEPQRVGWPLIQQGRHTLIAAPTGSGKTLAAFLSAIDALAREGFTLPNETRVLYVSPLRALSNDIQKNLQGPLAELLTRDPEFPDIRVLVRTGDTPARDRALMTRKPPHILVTTPESLYILLTTQSGRRILRTVRTVIVDEIHALAKDKRGSHLALSLERLEALAGSPQRIGLSATQKPLSEVGRFLVGVGRECELVDVGHKRQMDLGIEVPPSPLSFVCSHEQWGEVYERVSELILEHRTTLVFVNTRKLAERVAARLTDLLGADAITCHHSSMSRESRLDAEQRLKSGKLRALVATASLELGIDIGDVDLVIQIGGTRSIATFLQRVGRAGHAVRRIPKGRTFPLTLDELVESAALLRAVARGVLDRTPQPAAPLDILSQQIVASCVTDAWDETELYELMKRAWPYRNLTRDEFDNTVKLHTEGRRGLLHRDGVNGRLLGRRRARLTAVMNGGAIPDVADFQVIQESEGTFIGTLNEDFAIESSAGDIFQLGNTSWRIMRIERGILRVTDAKGQPPTVPFWLGEGPSRTTELSDEIGQLREEGDDPLALQELGMSAEAAQQICDYLRAGRAALGKPPTQRRVVIERFFDESGGMQMVLHAPFGGRINRGWGLALRKRFCRGFGFELQAAANEDAIIISLGLQHSFPLDEVFNYLHPNTVRKTLTQAVIDQPMFESRWRWNATRALVLERMQNGVKTPPPLLRMRAGDLLALTFPAAVACPENLPAGDLPIPMDHPLVHQTFEDCLTEATDIEGLTAVIRDLREGLIERHSVDTTEPSPFAQGILAAKPYSFLDDAPLEERRTQAVISRRTLDARTVDELGALDPDAVRRVREEAWPQPEDAEEAHEALLWMGFVRDEEAPTWRFWLQQLRAARRVETADGFWIACDATRDPKKILLGRLEALGPVFESDLLTMLPAMGGEAIPLTKEMLLELEREGVILRTRLDGQTAWCERRLLARVHRYTLDRLRREIEPVSVADYQRFLAGWQHLPEDRNLEGPRGVAEVVRQLAGFDAPAAAWEGSILPRRIKDYRREWMDELTLTGEVAWGRLWGGAACAIRSAPLCVFPREDLDTWLTLADVGILNDISGPARDIYDQLAARGAMFPQELQKAANLLPAHLEMGLADLVTHGLVTCDSYSGLRQLITPPSRRKKPIRPVGRWSLLRGPEKADTADGAAEFIARLLLRRYGVVFRALTIRERMGVSWTELARVLRRLELRGDVRGGRFIASFSGEQFALPEAIPLLRQARRDGDPPITAPSFDPFNLDRVLKALHRGAPVTANLAG